MNKKMTQLASSSSRRILPRLLLLLPIQREPGVGGVRRRPQADVLLLQRLRGGRDGQRRQRTGWRRQTETKVF